MKSIIAVDPSLRSTGVFKAPINGAEFSYSLTHKAAVPAMSVLGEILTAFLVEASIFDILVIEDYIFNSTNANSITMQASVGGIIRACFARERKKIIEIHPSAWKKHLDFPRRQPKGTKKEVAKYLEIAEAVSGKCFETTDEADAYMIYKTALDLYPDLLE